MKKVIASASLLALGASIATVATAAENKPWTVTGALRGFWDDNINTTSSGSPGKQSSFGVEVRPGAALDFDWGATKLTASYLYSMRYYEKRRNTDQSHDIELQLNHEFSARYSAGFMDSFVIAQEPEVIAGSGALATPIRSNGNNFRNTGGLDFRGQLTRLFGFIFTYQNIYYSYDENAGNTAIPASPSLSALLDRDENFVSIDSTWTITERTTGIFGYRFGAVDYLSGETINTPTGGSFVSSKTRNNYSHTLYVGADHSFRQDLTAQLRVGVEILDYYNSKNLPPPFTPNSESTTVSPYADVSLNYTYADGGLVTLGFRHEHNQTDQAVNESTLASQAAGVTVDVESSTVYATVKNKLSFLTPRLSASLTGQYQNSTFNQGPLNNETDNYYLFGVDLMYQINKYLSAEAGYNYDLICSDVTGRGYSRNQVFLGLSASY